MFPEEFWDVQDDKCDCTYQRIGMWTNPYLAETLEVRMCCIWAELYKLFPDKVRVTPAFLDYNRNEWSPELREWDGEGDMPESMWFRQLAKKHGKTVSEIRQEYKERMDEKPKGVKRRPQPLRLNLSQQLAIESLRHKMNELQAQVGAVLQEAGAIEGVSYTISAGMAFPEVPDEPAGSD